MMHNSLESRTSRSFSNKSSPPRPLDLKRSQSTSILACLTPPPTGWQDSAVEESFNDKFRHRPLASALFHIPPTPVTPQTLQPHKQTFELESEASTQRTKNVATVTAKKIGELLSNEGSGQSAKRARFTTNEADETSDCSRPAKRQIKESDLIYNPIAALELYGVPATYVKEKISKIAERFLNRMDGASCFLTFVPQTRPGLNRVRITPRIQPATPFHLNFVEGSSGTTSRDDKVPVQTTRRIETMPFHTEVAILRAPLLASLLLSGHVLMGDTLEMELPCPEVFPDVMKWLYTGKCAVSNRPRVEQCLEILCGR